MKWNDPKIKPIDESVPVLCKVLFVDDDEKITTTFCVCTYRTYSKSEKWEPVTEHLEVETMPSADYNINTREGFKVIAWTEITL